MITQYIIVGFIISAATGTAVYRLIRSLARPAGKCDGCHLNCGGCPVQELKKRS